jgi:hypothetical protein
VARSPFHRYLAAIVLLGYLLCGNGLARAFVWCVAEAGHSQVEVNPAGNCQVDCDPAPTPEPTVPPGLTASQAEGDCRDVSLLASQAKDARHGKQLSPVGANPPTALPPIPRQLAGALPYPLHPRYLQPPPSTALAALKTVVLLN